MNFIDHFDSVLSLSEGEMPICSGCMKEVKGDKLKSCSGCFKAKYCSRACQRRHWKIHNKKVCSDAKILRFNVADRVRIASGENGIRGKRGRFLGFTTVKIHRAIICDDGALHNAPEEIAISSSKSLTMKLCRSLRFRYRLHLRSSCCRVTQCSTLLDTIKASI